MSWLWVWGLCLKDSFPRKFEMAVLIALSSENVKWRVGLLALQNNAWNNDNVLDSTFLQIKCPEFQNVILFHPFSHRQTEHLGKSFLSYMVGTGEIFTNTKTVNALGENGVAESQVEIRFRRELCQQKKRQEEALGNLQGWPLSILVCVYKWVRFMHKNTNSTWVTSVCGEVDLK